MAKIFYLGWQRCGTKSFGHHFHSAGYKVCSWKTTARLGIDKLVHERRYLEVLNSNVLSEFDIFEDSPFNFPDFARFIRNYVEDARFVFFHRPEDDWYRSMVTHSNGLSFGDIYQHCYIYDRLDELDFILQSGAPIPSRLSLLGNKKHYTEIYKRHKTQIRHLFSDLPTTQYFEASLYDDKKFENLQSNFNLKDNFPSETHVHKSKSDFKSTVVKHSYLFG